jgi:hypothetical protein
MQRYTSSKTWFTAAAVAMGMAAFSGWAALRWWPAAIPAVLLVASAGLVLWLALRPAISVSDTRLVIGDRELRWSVIRRVDQTNWISPLVVDLTLQGGEGIRIIYPGDATSSNSLLETIQRNSKLALLNGIPHAQIYGEPEDRVRKPLPSPRYRLLTEEDEAEVERMYQKLKTAGHLDSEK